MSALDIKSGTLARSVLSFFSADRRISQAGASAPLTTYSLPVRYTDRYTEYRNLEHYNYIIIKQKINFFEVCVSD